jgi:hypothetical protein
VSQRPGDESDEILAAKAGINSHWTSFQDISRIGHHPDRSDMIRPDLELDIFMGDENQLMI